LLDPGWRALVPVFWSSGRPIATLVIARSFTPKAFESRRRMLSASSVTWIVWRIVEL
jgi:hypothetical protein